MLPEGLVDKKYKHRHEMLYSKVMKQLKTYRVNTVFIVSLEFLEYGYFDLVVFVRDVLILMVLMRPRMKYYA